MLEESSHQVILTNPAHYRTDQASPGVPVGKHSAPLNGFYQGYVEGLRAGYNSVHLTTTRPLSSALPRVHHTTVSYAATNPVSRKKQANRKYIVDTSRRMSAKDHTHQLELEELRVNNLTSSVMEGVRPPKKHFRSPDPIIETTGSKRLYSRPKNTSTDQSAKVSKVRKKSAGKKESDDDETYSTINETALDMGQQFNPLMYNGEIDTMLADYKESVSDSVDDEPGATTNGESAPSSESKSEKQPFDLPFKSLQDEIRSRGKSALKKFEPSPNKEGAVREPQFNSLQDEIRLRGKSVLKTTQSQNKSKEMAAPASVDYRNELNGLFHSGKPKLREDVDGPRQPPQSSFFRLANPVPPKIQPAPELRGDRLPDVNQSQQRQPQSVIKRPTDDYQDADGYMRPVKTVSFHSHVEMYQPVDPPNSVRSTESTKIVNTPAETNTANETKQRIHISAPDVNDRPQQPGGDENTVNKRDSHHVEIFIDGSDEEIQESSTDADVTVTIGRPSVDDEHMGEHVYSKPVKKNVSLADQEHVYSQSNKSKRIEHTEEHAHSQPNKNKMEKVDEHLYSQPDKKKKSGNFEEHVYSQPNKNKRIERAEDHLHSHPDKTTRTEHLEEHVYSQPNKNKRIERAEDHLHSHPDKTTRTEHLEEHVYSQPNKNKITENIEEHVYSKPDKKKKTLFLEPVDEPQSEKTKRISVVSFSDELPVEISTAPSGPEDLQPSIIYKPGPIPKGILKHKLDRPDDNDAFGIGTDSDLLGPPRRGVAQIDSPKKIRVKKAKQNLAKMYFDVSKLTDRTDSGGSVEERKVLFSTETKDNEGVAKKYKNERINPGLIDKNVTLTEDELQSVLSRQVDDNNNRKKADETKKDQSPIEDDADDARVSPDSAASTAPLAVTAPAVETQPSDASRIASVEPTDDAPLTVTSGINTPTNVNGESLSIITPQVSKSQDGYFTVTTIHRTGKSTSTNPPLEGMFKKGPAATSKSTHRGGSDVFYEVKQSDDNVSVINIGLYDDDQVSLQSHTVGGHVPARPFKSIVGGAGSLSHFRPVGFGPSDQSLNALTPRDVSSADTFQPLAVDMSMFGEAGVSALQNGTPTIIIASPKAVQYIRPTAGVSPPNADNPTAGGADKSETDKKRRRRRNKLGLIAALVAVIVVATAIVVAVVVTRYNKN